jgi:arylsulfatase A-like enzyme
MATRDFRGLRAWWVLVLLAWPPPVDAAEPSRADRPNIVLVYADDLGYGDPGAYGGTGIPTPAIDRLAREGLRFLNGYAASATCTPSRYALLTGEYPWRRAGTGVLPGDAGLILDPGRATLASLLNDVGYRTAVVGKWHLGLGRAPVDWNGPIRPGPLEVGFDECFLMPATGDRVPCVFVRGHHVVGLDPSDPIEVRYDQPLPGVPTGREFPERLRLPFSHGHDQSIVDGISRIGFMRGGTAALWKDEEIADTFVAEAVRFMESATDRPFFLFLSLHDPHVPRMPHRRFVGATALGSRGDAIVQADWCLGRVLETLDRLGLTRDTLVIFTSDNGPVLDDGYQDQAVERTGNHRPAGPLRGGKYSRYEAGCRVPLMARWPGRIRTGESDALLSQVDLPATLARLVGRAMAADEAPDSVPMLEALIGTMPPGPPMAARDHVVLHAPAGTAIRVGRWKYIPPHDGPPRAWQTMIETGNSPEPQLYDLEVDPGERRNLAADRPETVAVLASRLAVALQERGRPLEPEQGSP